MLFFKIAFYIPIYSIFSKNVAHWIFRKMLFCKILNPFFSVKNLILIPKTKKCPKNMLFHLKFTYILCFLSKWTDLRCKKKFSVLTFGITPYSGLELYYGPYSFQECFCEPYCCPRPSVVPTSGPVLSSQPQSLSPLVSDRVSGGSQ